MAVVVEIADIHFREANVRDTELLTKKVIFFLDKVKPDLIVILGDVLHNHDVTDSQSYNRALDFIKLCSSYTLTFLIIGNHDYINNSQFLTTSHFFNALKCWPNVIVVDKVTPYETKVGRLLFVPYVDDRRVIEALDTYGDWKSSRLIYSHIAIRGAQYGATTCGDECVEWKPEYPLLNIRTYTFISNYRKERTLHRIMPTTNICRRW